MEGGRRDGRRGGRVRGKEMKGDGGGRRDGREEEGGRVLLHSHISNHNHMCTHITKREPHRKLDSPNETEGGMA